MTLCWHLLGQLKALGSVGRIHQGSYSASGRTDCLRGFVLCAGGAQSRNFAKFIKKDLAFLLIKCHVVGL